MEHQGYLYLSIFRVCEEEGACANVLQTQEGENFTLTIHTQKDGKYWLECSSLTEINGRAFESLQDLKSFISYEFVQSENVEQCDNCPTNIAQSLSMRHTTCTLFVQAQRVGKIVA